MRKITIILALAFIFALSGQSFAGSYTSGGESGYGGGTPDGIGETSGSGTGGGTVSATIVHKPYAQIIINDLGD